MNRGLVNLSELRNSFNNADFKQGKSSYCFIRDDKIIKIYAPKYGDNYVPTEVCDFSKFSADTIVFPDKYIYENGKIVGEIAKYIKSESIDKSFNDKAIIKRIINSYEKVIEDMYLYSNIKMFDLCCVNILYSNNLGFHIIDTTEWCFSDNELKRNMHNFNSSLIQELLIEYLEIRMVFSKYYNTVDETYMKNIGKFGQAGQNLKKSIRLLMNNSYDFMRILTAYMDAYRVYSGNDAKTLKDINEFTKVLKKS